MASFSPLGKLAHRAIYFACVNFFLFLIGVQLSQDLPDRFSQSFHRIFGETDGSEAQGTLLWQPILDKIGKMTFIRQAGVPEWLGIGLWQF